VLVILRENILSGVEGRNYVRLASGGEGVLTVENNYGYLIPPDEREMPAVEREVRCHSWPADQYRHYSSERRHGAETRIFHTASLQGKVKK
jgi:hypothetical protein